MEVEKLSSNHKKHLTYLSVATTGPVLGVLLNVLDGSYIRTAILYVIRLNKDITKMEIHKVLENSGIETSYKNVSVIVDGLVRSNMVSVVKDKRYNRTVCNFDKKGFEKYFEAMNKSFNDFTDMIIYMFLVEKSGQKNKQEKSIKSSSLQSQG